LRRLIVVSLFNPAAWLDTLLVIGTVGATLIPPLRFSFAAGAVTASVIWFSLWVLGARSARRLMGAPHARSIQGRRLLDAGVAIAMIGMALSLALSL
jgi:L-lysine exporter family protein LysE/ArgO